jgi:hypothetical protein
MKSYAPKSEEAPTLGALGLAEASGPAPDVASVAAVGQGAGMSQGAAAGMQTPGAGNAFAADLAGLGFGGSDGEDDAEAIGGYAAAKPEDAGGEEREAFRARMDESFGTGGTGHGEAPSAAPADGGGAAQAGAPAAGSAGGITIDVSNHRPAPGSENFNRTVVGVGEVTTFWASQPGGTWSSSSGTGTVGADGEYEWTAPSTMASATITYRVGDATGTVTMTVLQPMAITATLVGANNVNQVPGQGGAGMDLKLTMHPTTVSFYNVQWLEQPGPVGGKWGYFEQATDDQLAHAPNAEWLMMGDDNQGVTDTAAFYGAPPPFSEGGFLWVIPNLFRVGNEGSGTVFFPSVQVMTLAADGTGTVSKFGNSTTRSA